MDLGPEGLALQADMEFGFRVGMQLDLRLLVPHGDGHWPFPGQVRCTGQVLRLQRDASGRLTVAARFGSNVGLHFPSVT